MQSDNGSAVRRAIAIVGGATTASKLLDVSAAAIFSWYRIGRVPDTRAAVLLAKATAACGQPVSVEELAGPLPELPTPFNRPRRLLGRDGYGVTAVGDDGVEVRVDSAPAARVARGIASVYDSPRRRGRPFQKEVHELSPNVRIVLVGDVAI